MMSADYFDRCEIAALSLQAGKKVMMDLALLAEQSISVKQWAIDLHNAIAVDNYDPADCLEGSCTPEFEVSVYVEQDRAIASAKRSN